MSDVLSREEFKADIDYLVSTRRKGRLLIHDADQRKQLGNALNAAQTNAGFLDITETRLKETQATVDSLREANEELRDILQEVWDNFHWENDGQHGVMQRIYFTLLETEKAKETHAR